MTLDAAIAGALRTVARAAGRRYIVRRGTAAIELTLIKTNVNIETDRGDGVTVEATRMDWLLADASQYAFDGHPTEPADGDTIEEAVTGARGNARHIYELQPLGTDACFRPIGPNGTGLRLHSKRTKVEPL